MRGAAGCASVEDSRLLVGDASLELVFGFHNCSQEQRVVGVVYLGECGWVCMRVSMRECLSLLRVVHGLADIVQATRTR